MPETNAQVSDAQAVAPRVFFAPEGQALAGERATPPAEAPIVDAVARLVAEYPAAWSGWPEQIAAATVEKYRGMAREIIALLQPPAAAPVALVEGLELLSPREREVVAHLCSGKRLSVIAKLMGLSPHTTRNHLKRSFQKLGCHSQNELIATYGGRHA